MTDIKERLRAAGHNETLATGQLYLDAADRIEELEADVARLRANIETHGETSHIIKDAVAAERERCASAHLWPTIGQIDKKWDEISDRSYANMSQTRQWMKQFSPEARYLARWACEQYAAAIANNMLPLSREKPMTDDIKERLRHACVGHPDAKIPWPHRLLHEALARIEELEASEQATQKLYQSLSDTLEELALYRKKRPDR